MFGSLNPSLIRARTLIRDLIYDSYRDGNKQKPTSSHLSSSKVVPFSSSSQALLCQMEKNKAKNGSKSSPFERADCFGETGKNKNNLERKTRKFNPNTTAYAHVLGTGMDTQDTLSSEW
ncbi:hypothetical protein YC2023_011202 [Brassica napus]